MTQYETDIEDEEEYDPHPTQLIEIKNGHYEEVDEEMVPLVRWLNSHPKTTTLFCCQGDDTGESTDHPYLMLVCTDMPELAKIAKLLEPFADGEFDFKYEALRHTFRFWSKGHFLRCLDWLWELEQVKLSAPMHCAKPHRHP